MSQPCIQPGDDSLRQESGQEGEYLLLEAGVDLAAVMAPCIQRAAKRANRAGINGGQCAMSSVSNFSSQIQHCSCVRLSAWEAGVRAR